MKGCVRQAPPEKIRTAFAEDLCRYAALVLDAAAAGLDRHPDLSTHQEFLGASRSHLEATGALAMGRAIAKRLVGKQSVSKQNEVAEAQHELFEILLVCALAAWLEQTERWYCMPDNPRRNLKMVCNQHAM